MVLLDFIRYQQHLTGTKIGCREGDCGACTIMVGELLNGELRYHTTTSCLMPLGNAAGKHIVTVEGLNFSHTKGHSAPLTAVQQAMADESATQCGFCTPGFVMALTCYAISDKPATAIDAKAAMDGNICRCTGYHSLMRAGSRISELVSSCKENRLDFARAHHIIPDYFAFVADGLRQLPPLPETPATHALPVGGGTDLYVQRHDQMTDARIRFTRREKNDPAVYVDNNAAVLSASATVTDLSAQPFLHNAFPQLADYIKLVSSTPIRNMATIAGNIVNASPIGDFSIFLLALDARLTLHKGSGKRDLPLRKFYTGYKQLAKQPEEQISRIMFPLPAATDFFHFEKISKRTHLDIASVNTACFLQMDGSVIISAGLSAGGVAPVPLFLAHSSEWLRGKSLESISIQELLAVVQSEISPIGDARGTAGYKRLLLNQLVTIHLAKALESTQAITV